jgi:hypothetical protein
VPDLTPRLGIKKPLGNETVSRQSFNDNWDIIDGNTAALGSNNQSVNKFKAANVRIDTRSEIITRDQNGKITRVDEKDGSTTVLSTIITRDANGKISSITETVTDNGVTTTITTTVNRDANGKITGTTRSVS